MANSLSVRIVEDGPRNAVVNIVGVVEDSDILQTPVISLASFVGNDYRTLIGLKVVDADFSVTSDLTVLLSWNATAPQPIAAFSNAGELRGRRHGGIAPDKTAVGYDGNINLQTKGFVAGKSYGFTVTLRMVKMLA